MELFEFPTCRVDKKIRLIELFAGVGSQAMALRDIGADFEHWFVCEFDKYAVASYNAIHGTSFGTIDIKTVHGQDLRIEDKDKYFYLLTYSFPCTDLSVAGKMEGMSKSDWENGNSTRSGLLWEVERILKELPKESLPDVLVMENVPQVHSDQNKDDFDSWCAYLRSRGYVNHWKDLNARDYGIPQNRERCFMVSILSNEFVDFEFPNPVKLDKVMKDFLEPSVDEKYYINSEKAKKLIADLIERGVITENREQRTENREIIKPWICVSSPQGRFSSPTASRQDTTQEYQTCRRTEAALLSAQGTKLEKVTDVATCLMARDYKGFGNQTANGVIESVCRTL